VTAAPPRRWIPVLAAAAAAAAVAGLGALVTDLGPWYYGLRQPAWKPPDWLFGPAWTLIFALAALAGIAGWRGAPDRAMRAQLVALFALNAVLNVLWSVLFFRLHRPDWALVEVGFLWLSIAALIVVLTPVSKAAGWLLVPYLAWVTFAALLNFAVVRLNHPFA
jgi:tryptophan-rich sensory protein